MTSECRLPQDALLASYRRDGAYTDCYCTSIDRNVSLGEFLQAFYTTPLFRLERIILKWLVDRPSTDRDVARLADGSADRFAAWSVEARAAGQILLCDMRGRTRSWLMCQQADAGSASQGLLYFGSAVVPVARGAGGKAETSAGFGLLLGFHRLYSRALLASARRRLKR